MEISSHPTSPFAATPEVFEKDGAQMVFHQYRVVQVKGW
jgi:hypothetical protein